MPIKRYKHVIEDRGDRYSDYRSVLRAHKDGSVVKYKDHARTIAALQSLNAELLAALMTARSFSTRRARNRAEALMATPTKGESK